MEITKEIILWFIAVQGTVIIGTIIFISKGINARLDKIDSKIEKLEIQANNIDKRLYAVECMIHVQDGCALKQDHQLKKAE